MQVWSITLINGINEKINNLRNYNSNNTSFDKKKNKRNVTIASVAGSATGIATAVAGIYAVAKKGNPSLALTKLTYNELDSLVIGTCSVLGGLTGGLLADKDKSNVDLKLREASQQIIGNTVFPLTFLAVANKLLDKSGFKLPQINSNSKFAKILNPLLSHLPSAVTTIAGLTGGMEVGNKVMNKVNNKIFKEEVKHDVRPEDYLVHTDDICLTAGMLLKDSPKLANITSKILPASFIVSGVKTGMQQNEND